MITYYTLITFAVCHWIFDFILQTDEMAKGKSSCNKHLTAHVTRYYAGLVLMALLNWNSFEGIRGAWMMVLWVVLNAVLHWITDYFTSRESSKYFKAARVHDAFVVIGLDQLIHISTLVGTFILATH